MTTDEHIKEMAIAHEVTAIDNTLKESISKSHAELIPKIHTEMTSIRSSNDKQFTKDDSGELVEYQNG